MLKTLEINKIFDEDWNSSRILEFIKLNKNEFEVRFFYNFIGITNSHLDVVYDHLQASFCIEKILEYSTFVSYREGEIEYKFFIAIKIIPIDFANLANVISNISVLFAREKDIDEDIIVDFAEEIEDYEDKIDKLVFKFPYEADMYYANLINAAYFETAFEMEEDSSIEIEDIKSSKYLKEIYKKYPEREYGFWESAASKTIEELFFVSTFCWIVPNSANEKKVLEYYSGIEHELKFERATLFNFNNERTILNDNVAIKINDLEGFAVAKQFIENILYQRFNIRNVGENIDHFEFYISEFEDVIILQSQNFKYIYFQFDKLTHNELQKLLEIVSPAQNFLENILGLNTSITLNWDSIDEEKFEELCYDIISLNPKFNSDSIQKMGKAKARDGGRDIVAYTNRSFDSEPQLYIFQCKLIKSNASLAKSNLKDAANIIDEYGAKGYGVFTSAVIDSTLYDMLDGFSRNKNIDTSNRWSVYNFERFLARNRALKSRYFEV